MQPLGRTHDGGLIEPIRCPACGHEVPRPETASEIDTLTGQPGPPPSSQFQCRHCGMVFELEEAIDE